MDKLNEDDKFQRLKSQMGITYQDQVDISPAKMPNYVEKVRT